MDKEIQKYKCTIQAGYLVTCGLPALLCSVCGNGVIVVLWDKVNKVGGMAHCVFPKPKFREKPSNYHVTVAVPALVKKMAKMSPGGTFEAYLFGGGAKGNYFRSRANRVVGKTRRLLKKLGVVLVSEDVGGEIGRKVVFSTKTGEAMVYKTRNIRKTDWDHKNIERKNERKN